MSANLFNYYLGVFGFYGFYRSWTLPIWTEKKDLPIRVAMSIGMGAVYAFPPVGLIKCAELGMRMHDVYDGTRLYNEKESRYYSRYGNSYNNSDSHWKEWGFYHPKML